MLMVVKIIVITGGIASGKSVAVRMLQELAGRSLRVYDCDKEVNYLLNSGKLSRELLAVFGTECVHEDGTVNREYLRDVVFRYPASRQKLEDLIHPKIISMCLTRCAEASKVPGVNSFIIDVPIYFESGANLRPDKVCVLAAGRETQSKRIQLRNGFTPELTESIIDTQLPTQEKINRADVVFWNDGSLDNLREQVELFYHTYLEHGEPEEKEPETIDLNELRNLSFVDVRRKVDMVPLRGTACLTKAELLFELGKHYLQAGHPVVMTGVLEQAKEHYAMLRDPKRSFRTSPDDVYISGELIRQYRLRVGNLVRVTLRPYQSKDKYLAAADVLSVEGKEASAYDPGVGFERLTPLFPKERLLLENKEIGSSAMRILDLITPLGKGQRGLIVAPPRGGKTVLMKTMARSIRANYPDAHLLVLLLDERPEEVTDFEETVDADVYASTFDEPSRRHAQVADLVLERAKRLVEQKEDVVILLDSLTRLSRGYNANQIGGRVMSGGLGSNALEKPRKFFGAARNVEEGGSLTIIATCLVDTESRMDEVIFEEFKGTGNMEIRLDRELSERRIYPAISIPLSGTRNDDRLYHEDEMQRILSLRRQLAQMPGWEGLEALLKNIAKTQNNAELLLRGLR